MSDAPEVSFVMPVWQPRVDWLRESVTTALGQLDCDLELIVVDDGNATSIAAVLDDIRDPRLRVVRIAHAGASAARNAGTTEARGAHIRYIDADDVLVPDGTRRLLDASWGHTIAYGATEVCDDSLGRRSVIRSEQEGDAAEVCLLARFDVRHVSMLFPASVVRAAGPWDTELTVCEDWDFVLRCLEHAPVKPVDAIVTRYRRHGSSVTRSASTPSAWRWGQRRVIEKYFERHPGESGSELARSAWLLSYRSAARRALATRSLGHFLRDTVALTRFAPREALALWGEAITIGLRRARTRVRN